MTSPHFEDIFSLTWLYDVNNPRCVLFLIQTLQDKVASLWTIVAHKMKVLAVGLDHEWISSLADLALERLPEVRNVVLSILDSFLGVEPLHQTFEMNVSYAS